MRVSVLMVDMDGLVKKICGSSYFGLQVIIVGSLDDSGTCKLKISCGTRSKLA